MGQDRAGAAYGGIMGVGGRKRYGIGSRLRKLIPNEVSRVAEVAAPFVAPFNPIAGGLMAGLGGYDRTGKLGSSLVRGLGTYGLGQGARYLGGAGFQKGIDPRFAGGEGLGRWAQSPIGKETGLKMGNWKMFGGEPVSKTSGVTDKITEEVVTADSPGNFKSVLTDASEAKLAAKKGTSGIMKFIDDNAKWILLGSMGIAAATATPQDMKEAVNATRGTKLDIDGIRAEVQEAFEAGEDAWNELKRTKYPYMGEFSTKKAEGGRIGYNGGGAATADLLIRIKELQDEGLDYNSARAQAEKEAERKRKAQGGRIGLYVGGLSIPSDYTMQDARKTSMQDKMGGITEVMKQADLHRQGDIGQMYMAEGGLMDLGGMEKDYRNDGGFVPIGGEEKADDVPARLSKNEFVFTADAVRAAGGGDIDKGAGIMEKVMENLEQGGQISEESQGLSGAQEMFDVSERLSEVV